MSKLRFNIIALTFVQFSNYLIPLLIIPYLTRVLGVVGYGQVAFVQAIMLYLSLIVDYGFSWGGARKISEHREDKRLTSEIFVNIWTTQAILAIGVALLTCVIIYFFGLSIAQPKAIFWGFLIVFASVFFPVWAFQGLEKIKEVALIQVASKFLMIPLFFVFVNTSEDYVYAIIILGGVPCVAGLYALHFLFHNEVINFVKPCPKNILAALSENFSLFISKISLSSYTALTPIILGYLAGPSAVGVYSLADKIRQTAQAVLSPVSQAIFPRISFLSATNRNKADNLLRKSFAFIFLLAAAASISLYLMADFIVTTMAGSLYYDSILLLKLFSILPLLFAMSNFFGVQVLIPMKRNKLFLKIAVSSSIIHLLLVFILIKTFGPTGGVLSCLLTELFVMISVWFFSTKNKLFNIFSKP